MLVPSWKEAALEAAAAKALGKKVGYLSLQGKEVLHEGHRYLADAAKKHCDFLIMDAVSIQWQSAEEINFLSALDAMPQSDLRYYEETANASETVIADLLAMADIVVSGPRPVPTLQSDIDHARKYFDEYVQYRKEILPEYMTSRNPRVLVGDKMQAISLAVIDFMLRNGIPVDVRVTSYKEGMRRFVDKFFAEVNGGIQMRVEAPLREGGLSLSSSSGNATSRSQEFMKMIREEGLARCKDDSIGDMCRRASERGWRIFYAERYSGDLLAYAGLTRDAVLFHYRIYDTEAAIVDGKSSSPLIVDSVILE